jgi:hypothetical protein
MPRERSMNSQKREKLVTLTSAVICPLSLQLQRADSNISVGVCLPYPASSNHLIVECGASATSLKNFNEVSISAEVLWTMHMVEKHLSLRSYDWLTQLFDESLNNISQKGHIHFRDEQQQIMNIHCWSSEFLGSATADNLLMLFCTAWMKLVFGSWYKQ